MSSRSIIPLSPFSCIKMRGSGVEFEILAGTLVLEALTNFPGGDCTQ
jgi:hypothetical protein